ncbi:MAG: Gfo/Idh/MocA family oxidoreductase [Bacteroidales bacterium]|nr:Gfo/Idh/MocA family oxidoreductase [Candidatus Cryptobacteroides onthequi]
MKRLFVLLSVAAAILVSCSKTTDGIIRTEVPARPAGQTDMLGFAADPIDTVRVGFVGLGMRGPGAVQRFTHLQGVKIVALCDVLPENVEKCQKTLREAGLPEAAAYSGDTDVYKELCAREDLDLVYVCTDWSHHVPVALCAMENGKHAAIEVPAATSLQEIWDLINTSERTRKHCIMLENCCYDFYEMTALNMAQQGLFGEIIHVEGSYHHCLEPFWPEYWNNWRLDFNRTHKGDLYPTHGLGPVCQVLNIHRGDQMKTLVAMETSSRLGIPTYKKITGKDIDSFESGDHIMTMISTKLGKTIQIQHDVMTPRPYDRMYQLVGTKGYAQKYPVPGFSFEPEQLPETIDHENLSGHSFVPADVRDALMEQYKPGIVKEIGEYAKEVGGHGGMDFIMDYRLVYCLRNGLPLDIDVYDLAEWCCLAELGSISIANGSAPVEVPDFTRGGQDKIKGFSYAFAK